MPASETTVACRVAYRGWWIISHTRGAESGNDVADTPNSLSADATALEITAAVQIKPPSPAPLTPSGLLGEGYSPFTNARRLRKIARRRHQIFRVRADQQLSVFVVVQVFEQRAAEALHHRADDLALQWSAD